MNIRNLATLLGILAFSASSGAIPLNSPTTDWHAVQYVGVSRTDYLADQQTGDYEGDLVGSAVGVSPVQTAFYFDFDGVQIGFRVRVNGDHNPQGSYEGAIWVGMMLDNNDSVDLFAGVIDKGSTHQIGFYNPGTGANVSPSTTSIVNGSPYYQESISSSNFLWTPVTVGLSGNDPVVGGTNDIGGDGRIDRFATWVLPFSQLQASASARGFTVTASTPIRFVVGTSQQGNSINQDLNGTSGNIGSSSTFATLGAVSPVVTASGGVVPEPGTVSFLVLSGVAALWLRRRQRCGCA